MTFTSYSNTKDIRLGLGHELQKFIYLLTIFYAEFFFNIVQLSIFYLGLLDDKFSLGNPWPF